MAGARLGFGIGSRELTRDLVRIKYSTNPYNVNRATAAAGIGALLDKDYFQDNCKKVIEAREYTVRALSKLGFELTDSSANFVFARSERINGGDLYLELKRRGILVRHFNSDRISEYVRITVGTMEQMQTLVYTIKEILEGLQ